MFRRTESSITAITSGTASFIDDNLNVENGCDRDVSKLPPEVEQGNVEYKLQLISPPPDRLQHLITQLKWRLAEGYGEAMYEIGVSDKGSLVGLDPSDLHKSIETLKKMANELKADVEIVRTRETQDGKAVAEVLVRKCLDDLEHFLEVRVAIIGGPDAGKSTLLGVLTHSTPDNGNGKARLNLLRHRHEIESGRTSSISHQIIGFTPTGTLVNYSSTNIQTWSQICETASKIITFLDMCGHPKYLKTTISGLTGHSPDVACLIVGANTALIPSTTREQLGIAIALSVPVFVVITKLDIGSPSQLTKTLTALLTLLKSPGIRRIPHIIQSVDDIVATSTHFTTTTSIVPIFLTSSTTTEGINFLTEFFNLLPKPPSNNDYESLLDEEAEYQIEEVYSVPDVGYVVGGKLLSGRISTSPQRSTNTIYYVGPDHGKFVPVSITSIHRHRCPIRYLKAGQAASCALSFSTNCEKFKLRKGQIILESPSDVLPVAVWSFTADINILHVEGDISVGTRVVVFCGSVRQGARITHIEVEDGGGVKTGEMVRMGFGFLVESEWVGVGWKVLVRGEGGLKGVGKVVGGCRKGVTGEGKNEEGSGR